MCCAMCIFVFCEYVDIILCEEKVPEISINT